MHIISITRKEGPEGVPDTFTLGMTPTEGGEVTNGPKVSLIKYFGISTVYDKVYRGPVYIVEFENSSVKRVIPADNNIIDVAVETVTEKPQEIKVPELPE